MGFSSSIFFLVNAPTLAEVPSLAPHAGGAPIYTTIAVRSNKIGRDSTLRPVYRSPPPQCSAASGLNRVQEPVWLACTSKIGHRTAEFRCDSASRVCFSSVVFRFVWSHTDVRTGIKGFRSCVSVSCFNCRYRPHIHFSIVFINYALVYFTPKE